jgi:hypothetical protein
MTIAIINIMPSGNLLKRRLTPMLLFYSLIDFFATINWINLYAGIQYWITATSFWLDQKELDLMFLIKECNFRYKSSYLRKI